MNALALALAAASQSPKVHLTAQTRIVAAVLALLFMALVLEMIRRDKLQERFSVVWFVAGLGMLAGAAFPGLLTLVADAMGVRDTNVALFSIMLPLPARPGAQLQRDDVPPSGADHPAGAGAGAGGGPRAGRLRRERRRAATRAPRGLAPRRR